MVKAARQDLTELKEWPEILVVQEVQATMVHLENMAKEDIQDNLGHQDDRPRTTVLQRLGMVHQVPRVIEETMGSQDLPDVQVLQDCLDSQVILEETENLDHLVLLVSSLKVNLVIKEFQA
jgi:hypothetical protein